MKKVINLNVFRTLFCLIIAYVIFQDAAGYDNLHLPSGINDSLSLFDFFNIKQLSLSQAAIVRTVLILTLLTAAVGIFTRLSLILATILYFLYIGNQLAFINSPFSEYGYHSKSMGLYILLIMSIMAISPGIDRFSIVGLKQNAWKGWSKERVVGGIQGIDAIQWMLGLAYLGSAASKLMHDWHWADGYTLQSYLLRNHLLYDTQLGGLLMQNVEWCRWLGILTFLFEGTFILCLIFRKLKPVYIISGIAFHTGVYLAMNINFGVYFFVSYLSFINYYGLAVRTGMMKPAATLYEKLRMKPAVFMQQSALIAIFGIQLISITFERQSWPVSNYGVFIHRHVPSEIAEYRFACSCEHSEEYEWITQEHLPRSKTTLSRMIKLAIKFNSAEELGKIIYEVKESLIRFKPRCNELILMKGRGIIRDDGKLYAQFEPIYREYFDTGVLYT